MRALAASLKPDPKPQPPPRAAPPPPNERRALEEYGGYSTGFTDTRRDRVDTMLDVTATGAAFDGLVPGGLDRMRLIVGRTCKINVRAADNFGNARSTVG